MKVHLLIRWDNCEIDCCYAKKPTAIKRKKELNGKNLFKPWAVETITVVEE
jgi:hypothetical protein